LITRPSQGIEPKSTMKISNIERAKLFSKRNFAAQALAEIDPDQFIVL